MVNIATITTAPRKTPVTTCNGIREKTLSELMSLRVRGLSYEQIATRYGVNKAQIHRAVNGDWSDAVVSAVTGERWLTILTRVKLAPTTPPPDELVIELRRCDVTDRYYIPTCAGQRFHPDTSPALRRAARRDLDVAREKYARMGDWGKR